MWLLQRLHRHRNYVHKREGDDSAQTGGAPERTSGGVSGTLQELLAATRAHVGFALRTGGEQALANVLHIAELARHYEMGGGISFRGFVEELRVAAETAQASEAPILEEDSDGVRMMTVHKAKGLEFPVVILADLTCKLSRPDAGRWIDPSGSLCALKLGGWAPTDLLLHGYEEAERDKAEGQRLAYVAATRARDVLVVPVVGDEVYEGGWLDPLMPAVNPSLFARESAHARRWLSSVSVQGLRADATRRRSGAPNDRCAWKLSALGRPRAPSPETRDPESYSVVWWDPRALKLDADSGYGLRRDDLISKDGDPAKVAARLAEYQQWRAERDEAVARARVPSLQGPHRDVGCGRPRSSTRRLHAGAGDRSDRLLALGRAAIRAALRNARARDAGDRATRRQRTGDRGRRRTRRRGFCRPLAGKPYADEEVYAAVEVVTSLLRDPLFDRVQAGRARRAVRPRAADRLEGSRRHAHRGNDRPGVRRPRGLTVVDFKTDRELATDLERYTRQLTVYCQALGTLRNTTAKGILARV